MKSGSKIKSLASTFFILNYCVFLHCEKMKIQTHSWLLHFTVT
jgi:hypothetical protein